MESTDNSHAHLPAEPNPELPAELVAHPLPTAVDPQALSSHSPQAEVTGAAVGSVQAQAEPAATQAEPMPSTSQRAETADEGARPQEAAAPRAATAPVSSSSSALRTSAAFSAAKSTASSPSPARRPARRSALAPPPTEKRLSKDELAAMAERLCKPKVPPPPQKRVRAVKLVYQREKGSKTYIPKLVPAKKVDVEEQTAYMVSLAQRCAEREAAKQAELEKKFLQPLTHAKKVRKASMEAHLGRLERMYHGQKAAE